MIYIASPYSHPSNSVRYHRFLAARDYTLRLMSQSITCFSPIVYGHQFAQQFDLPTNHLYWRDLNEHMLLSTDRMDVLCLHDWESSQGVAHEIDFASRHGIETRYVDSKGVPLK